MFQIIKGFYCTFALHILTHDIFPKRAGVDVNVFLTRGRKNVCKNARRRADKDPSFTKDSFCAIILSDDQHIFYDKVMQEKKH